MSKKLVQQIEAVCDRCGAEGYTGNSQGRLIWGELEVSYKGHHGSRTWDGSGAGGDIKGNVWLCVACTDKFLEFMGSYK